MDGFANDAPPPAIAPAAAAAAPGGPVSERLDPIDLVDEVRSTAGGCKGGGGRSRAPDDGRVTLPPPPLPLPAASAAVACTSSCRCGRLCGRDAEALETVAVVPVAPVSVSDPEPLALCPPPPPPPPCEPGVPWLAKGDAPPSTGGTASQLARLECRVEPGGRCALAVLLWMWV